MGTATSIMAVILVFAVLGDIKLAYDYFEAWRTRGLPNGEAPRYWTLADQQRLAKVDQALIVIAAQMSNVEKWGQEGVNDRHNVKKLRERVKNVDRFIRDWKVARQAKQEALHHPLQKSPENPFSEPMPPPRTDPMAPRVQVRAWRRGSSDPPRPPPSCYHSDY